MGRPADDPEPLHQAVDRLLRAAGQRYTEGRRRLVQLLADAGRPITVPELVLAHPENALSSAYRNVAVLEQVGVVARIASSDEHARFELAESVRGEHHHHLICQACGRVDDFTLPAAVERSLDRASTRAAAAAGFHPATHRLDLLGSCARCAAPPRRR